MPKVSVIMGAFNCGETIGPAIDSILAQTFGDWECIVCDDGSTDHTWKVLQRIAEKESRLILLRNQKNAGLGAALNRGIGAASGVYLARHDADDISYANRFEEQVAFLDLHREVSVVGSYVGLVDNEGVCWGEEKYPESPRRTAWLRGPQVIHASVMMRRQDIVSAGGYDERALRMEDYDLWFRLINKGYVITTLPKALYNVHRDLSDYSRKKFRYRLKEMRLRLRGSRMLAAPPLHYLYVLKPLVTGLLPKRLLYTYHRRKFKETKSPDFLAGANSPRTAR